MRNFCGMVSLGHTFTLLLYIMGLTLDMLLFLKFLKYLDDDLYKEKSNNKTLTIYPFLFPVITCLGDDKIKLHEKKNQAIHIHWEETEERQANQNEIEAASKLFFCALWCCYCIFI
jgi:hypothetical protein